MSAHGPHQRHRTTAERQQQILDAIASGVCTYRRIAQHTGLTESLVRYHCKQIPKLQRTPVRLDRNTRRSMALSVEAL